MMRSRGTWPARSPGRAPLPLAVGVVLALAGPVAADVVDEAWKRGNEAYLRGDLAAAVAAYERIDRVPVVSPVLAYNLGVAYFRQGQLGRAIWAFERAVALDPDDEDARYNLAQARQAAARRARDKIEGAERDPIWIRVVSMSSPSAQTWLFVGLYLGCFALLFAWRRAGDTGRAPLAAGAAILGVGALMAGVLLIGRMRLDETPFGIVLPDQVAVKEGADPNHRTAFRVHAGLRARLLERDQDWWRIRLANGLEGWVRDQDIGRL